MKRLFNALLLSLLCCLVVTTFTACEFFGNPGTTDTSASENSSDYHSFGEWTVSNPATKKRDGTKTRICSVCGASETEAIAAYGKIGAGAALGISAGSVIVSLTGGFSMFWFVVKKKSLAELVSAFASLKNKTK